MTTQESIDALTLQTSTLLADIVILKNGLESRIASAVLVSVNASQIPLINMATNVINTQTLFIGLIS